MTPKIATKIPEFKKNIVDEMSDLIRKHSITALVNMSNIPAPQLQAMRREMKGKIRIYMTKKRLMKIALDKSKNEKKNVGALANYFEGMPAFIFSNENPFRLSRLLQKSKTKAPAKAGQTAPSDIVISKGRTSFAPGPIISELSSIGLKVGVEGGKIAIKEDTVIARKGEKIKPKVAEILARMDIRPMDVGLGMVAAYEDGIIYARDVLEIDENAFNDKLNNAAVQAFNLAFNITYTTKGNISLLIAKAFNDAKALGLSENIFDEGIIEHLLGKAEREMLSLKNIAKKENELEEVEESKEQLENDVDEKVRKMVENTKKFAEGKQETASDILKEVSQQEKKENAEQQRKDKKSQEDKKSQKEVEELAKELLRKGTLRK